VCEASKEAAVNSRSALALLAAAALPVSACGSQGSAHTSARHRSATARPVAKAPDRTSRAASSGAAAGAAPRAHISRAALRACRRLSSAAAVRHFVALATRAHARHRSPVLRGLIVQVRSLPKAALAGPAGARYAAALYAVTQSKPSDRAGAFTGCSRALHAGAAR
jgi:hypothetical protein